MKEQMDKQLKERTEELAKEDGDGAAMGKSCGCIPKKWRSKMWSSKKTEVAQPLASRVAASSAEDRTDSQDVEVEIPEKRTAE